jgi:hypothetical protein
MATKTKNSIANFWLPQSITKFFQLPNFLTKGNQKFSIAQIGDYFFQALPQNIVGINRNVLGNNQKNISLDEWTFLID